MLRPKRRLFGVVLVLSATMLLGSPVSVGAAAGAPVAGSPVADAPVVGTGLSGPVTTRAAAYAPEIRLPKRVHGGAGVAAIGDRLDEVARANDMRPRELSSLLREDPTAWVSTSGAVYFADPAHESPSAVATPASAPLHETFELHSKPGSKHTIFLDFDGADVAGTWWTTDFPSLNPTINGWDPAGNGVDVFSPDERTLVQGIWSMVAEDFAPFDVDVTTADPGPDAIYHETAADTEYGVQVLIGDNPQANNALCSNTCSGIAWRGGEATNTFMAGDSGYGASTASFVFPRGTPNAQLVAKIASHEVGHQMDLRHDGDAGGEYSLGHGIWAPIMGNAQFNPVSQWSRGDYPGATNQENDLAMIAGHLGWRGDEAGRRFAEAAPVPTGTAYITDRDDQDTYLLGRCVGTVDLAAATAQFANLDIELTLRNASGAVVATDDPASARVGYSNSLASGLDARIAKPVADGYYYLTVDGVGHGDWATGYDDYGSLGAYTLDIGSTCDGAWPTGVSSKPLDVAADRPDDLVANKVTVSWAAPASAGNSDVTGYVVMHSGGGVVDVSAGAASYTWTDLGYSTPYSFRVVAMNEDGPSHESTVAFTTPREFVPPSAPTDVAATYQPGPRSASVTWTAPDNDGGKPIVGYDVYLGDTQATSVNGVVTAPASDVLVTSVGAGARSADVAGIVLGRYNYLRVRARNALGQGLVTSGALVQPPNAPANDDFAAPRVLTGTSGSQTGDSTYSTGQTDDPVPPHDRSGAGDSSVWFTWTAPGSRVVTFESGGLDTTLAAYTGSSLQTLEQVAGNDDRSADDTTSRIRFDAVEGTTYRIAVDGYRANLTGLGAFTLSWRLATATETSLRATPITYNRVDLSASVNPVAGGGSPAGSVEFREDGALVGTVTVDQQQARLSLTQVVGGEHTYTATFVSEDVAAWAPSAAPARTATALGVPSTPDLQAAVADESVTLSATFGAGATGQVRFREGSDELETVDLVDGVAVYTIDPASEGVHSYLADYLPDTAAFEPATSAARTVTVLGRTTSTVAASVDKATVTVVVSVASGGVSPTGWVELRDDTTLVADPAQVIDGKARFVLGQVPAGVHTYTATYAPYAGPASSPHTGSRGTGTVTVAPWATRATINVARSGSAATLTAWADNTVAGGRVAGDIEFLDSGELIATATIAGGTATHTIAVVRPGEHSYSARFIPAAATVNGASTSSAAAPFTVATGTSSVFLAPTVTGHQVALLAQISSTLGDPDGTVDLLRDGTVLRTLDVSHSTDTAEGRARFVLDDVPSGSYRYTAVYRPKDTLHVGSEHSQTVVVDATWTDIGLQVATDPSRRAHVLTARVSGRSWSGLPAGSVTFYDGPLQVGGPVPVVDGSATLDHTGVATGAHGYRATFMPTSFYEFNISSTAGLEPASMGLSSTATSMAAAAEGQTVTLRARVTSDYDVPTGSSVEFTEQGQTVGTATVGSDGVATRILSGVQPGTHTYAASFRDDSWQQVYADSASHPETVSVVADELPPDPTPVATSTSLSAAATGRSVTLDVAVTDGTTRAGRVVFYDGDVALDVVGLSSGSARLVLSDVSVGLHRYRAEFVPDDPAVEAGSISATREVTIQSTPTTTTLRSAVSGTSVTLTAAVSGESPAYLVGSVVFYDGAQQVATYALGGGSTAAVVVVTGSVGQHTYRAEFVPASTDVAGSSSASVSVTVAKVVTRTTLTAPRAAKAGARPKVTVKVTGPGGVPSGKVLLTYGAKKVTLTLKKGQASFKLPKVKKRKVKVTASYLGDATTAKSTASRTIKVTK